MNQRKLNLDELQVESFVTAFESDQDGTVMGGGLNDGTQNPIVIHTQYYLGCNTSAIESIGIPCRGMPTQDSRY